MSTKHSIFLTKDNEHCYLEMNEPFYEDSKFIGYTMVLEISKENVKIEHNGEDALVLEIHPNSELHKLLGSLRK